jgi:hypothetical protein
MERRHFSSALTFAIAAGVLGGIAATAQAINLESWDDKVAGKARWMVLKEFSDDAVLDKETQLVWEKSPSTTASTSWFEARSTCADKAVGNRKGWRLPSFAELATLIDPTAASAPFLPLLHPFIDVLPQNYWSATTDPDSVGPDAWIVDFSSGFVGTGDKFSPFYTWCVRGGMNADRY